jgi:hypothetical protein
MVSSFFIKSKTYFAGGLQINIKANMDNPFELITNRLTLIENHVLAYPFLDKISNFVQPISLLMTLADLSHCRNKNSEFTLIDGTKVRGIIFYFNESPQYKFLPEEHIEKFNKYDNEGNEEKMKQLFNDIALDDIVSAERL